MDNDQIGPLLSQVSDESMLRKRKDMNIDISDEDSSDDYMNRDGNPSDRQFKTPLSDRF